MKRYSEYKDSGVKWIGMIPEHWKIEPFGRHFSYGKGLPITKADLVSEGVAVISYGQIHSKLNIGTTMDDCLLRYVDPKYIETNPQCLLNKNDFVFADTSEDIEGCGNFAFNDRNESIFAGYHTIIVRPIDILHPKYYAYLFQSKKWKSQVQTLVNGVKVFSISRGILKKASLLIPTYTEQQEIVTYLDTKVAKIDEYISIAEKKIAALEELKQTIIAEAVTRGIHKDVPMKDSGVKWIGMIPEHWKVNKIRSHFKERRVKVSDKDFQALSVAKIGIVPQLEDACKTDNGDNRKQVLKGDFVVNSRSDRKGSCGISPLDGSVSLINIVLRPFDIVQEYVHYLFRSYNYIEEFYRNGRGIVADLWTTRYSEMRNIQIPVPPLSEQQEIVTYIETKVANINQLCQAERSQIEKLKEYKQRLISDVVTGKLKVTND